MTPQKTLIKKKTGPAPVPTPPSPDSRWEWVKAWLLGALVLAVGSVTWNNFNGGGIGCWPAKKILVHQIGHIKVEGLRNGTFMLDGICYGKDGKVAVLDHQSRQVFLFDLNGNFLGDSKATECGDFSSNQVTDPKTHRRYSADYGGRRVTVVDGDGKLLKNIALKDHPTALALDPFGRLFVGYSDHSFVQVFSANSGGFLGDLAVENPGDDYSYFNAAFLLTTDDGYLMTGDRYSVWVYRLPPA